MEPRTHNTRPRPRRPFSVTLLAVLVLIITSIHLIRFLQTLNQWDFLSELPGVSPLYLTGTGLFWTLIGLPLFWWLWRGYPGTPTATLIAALAYTFYVWLDRLFVVDPSVERLNWPFAAGMTVLLLAFTAWTMSRSTSRRYFAPARSEAEKAEEPEKEKSIETNDRQRCS
jgi:hypothetical protein